MSCRRPRPANCGRRPDRLGRLDPATKRKIELAAEDVVIAHETGRGWECTRVGHEKIGFDIRSQGPADPQTGYRDPVTGIRRIEVKGRKRGQTIRLTMERMEQGAAARRLVLALRRLESVGGSRPDAADDPEPGQTPRTRRQARRGGEVTTTSLHPLSNKSPTPRLMIDLAEDIYRCFAGIGDSRPINSPTPSAEAHPADSGVQKGLLGRPQDRLQQAQPPPRLPGSLCPALFIMLYKCLNRVKRRALPIFEEWHQAEGVICLVGGGPACEVFGLVHWLDKNGINPGYLKSNHP